MSGNAPGCWAHDADVELAAPWALGVDDDHEPWPTYEALYVAGAWGPCRLMVDRARADGVRAEHPNMLATAQTLLLVLVLLVTVLVVWVKPAAAEHDTTPLASPDSHGRYAYCDLAWNRDQYQSFYIGATCAHATSSGAVTGLYIAWSTQGGSHSVELSMGTTGLQAGQARGAQNDWQVLGQSSYSMTVSACSIRLGGNLLAALCRPTTQATGFPAMPDEFYVGGTDPNPPTEVDPPLFACGRTLRDVGGGQYFADLEAVGPLNPPTNEWTTADVPDFSGWRASWSDQRLGAGQEVTVALPALSTMPAGGWVATFHGVRQYTVPNVEPTFSPDGYTQHEIDHDVNPATADRLVWVLDTLDVAGWANAELNRRDWSGPTSSPLWEQAYPTVDYEAALARWLLGGGYITEAAGGGDWAVGDPDLESVTGYCTVLLDPSRPSTGDRHATDGRDGEDGTDGQGDDEDGTSGGEGSECEVDVNLPGKGVPVMGAVVRAVEGIVEAIGELACKLLDVIKDALEWAFVPDFCDDVEGCVWDDLLAQMQTKFPFSVFADLSGAGVLVVDELEAAAAGDGCATVDARGIVPSQIAGHVVDDSALLVHLPTPSSSACDGIGGGARNDVDNTAGDLGGYREHLRLAIAVFGFWLPLLVALTHRFSASKIDGD